MVGPGPGRMSGAWGERREVAGRGRGGGRGGGQREPEGLEDWRQGWKVWGLVLLGSERVPGAGPEFVVVCGTGLEAGVWSPAVDRSPLL